MTEQDIKRTPFPPPAYDSEEEREQTFMPPDPNEFMHGVLDDEGIRYEAAEPPLSDIEPYAQGGTGEIFTAKDEMLGRTVAVKTLRPKHQYCIDQIERMLREAKAAAQLEHPNIIPIHSMGVSPTKGIYFTMKRLRGDSLRHIVNQLALRNPAYARVYTRTVRMSIFMKICQGISYAHSKGIIHRDLKPENILVGNYGEVTIIDWGLVKKMDAKRSTHVPGRRKVVGIYPEASSERDSSGGVVASPQASGSSNVDEAVKLESVSLPSNNLTQNGQLNGTPRFMSPEQIMGDVDDIDTRSDIYALGIILYELLTFRNPFENLLTDEEIFNAVQRGLYQRPRQTERKYSISPEIEAICLKAMALNKDQRYQAVGELIKDLQAHQEGLPVSAYKAPSYVRMAKFCKRNPIKVTVLVSFVVAIFMYLGISSFVDSYYFNQTIRQVQITVRTGEYKLKHLDELLKTIEAADKGKSPGEPVQMLSKQRYDDMRDDCDNYFNEANLLLNSLRGGHLRQQSQIYRLRERIMAAQIDFCLKHGKINELKKLRAIMPATLGDNMDAYSSKLRRLISEMETALSGVCYLQVESNPSGADVTISIMETADDGRLAPGIPIHEDLLYTPVYKLPLGRGTYQLTMRMDGAPDLSFPVTLRHGESRQLMIDIPAEIPYGMVYVPGGTCMVGGELSPYKREYEVDLAPFYILSHEVTNREYIAFWMTLKDTRLQNQYMSRIILSRGSNLPKNAWNKNGKTIAEVDLDKPVVGISREAAQAYCEWIGRIRKRLCRLPTVEEWEKAARGTDGRLYPWGNSFAKEYAFTLENTDARKLFGLWAKPGSFPADVSPYGVFDMAGNVREWTMTDFPDGEGFFPQIKGASSSTPSRYLPLERADDTAVAPSDVGFRYVMPYLPTDTVEDQLGPDDAVEEGQQ